MPPLFVALVGWLAVQPNDRSRRKSRSKTKDPIKITIKIRIRRVASLSLTRKELRCFVPYDDPSAALATLTARMHAIRDSL